MEKDVNSPMDMHATTILAIKKNGHVAMAGDGQVTLGQTMIMKHTARKIRRVGDGNILAGFAGTTADAFTLFELFEAKLKEYHGNLTRAAVELTKQWRRDKYLQKLEAMLLLADREHILLLSGTGDVIEPDDNVAAIGSGGPYALAAARALLRHSDLDAETIARDSIQIASEICVYKRSLHCRNTLSRPPEETTRVQTRERTYLLRKRGRSQTHRRMQDQYRPYHNRPAG